MNPWKSRPAELADVPAITRLVSELGYPTTEEDMRSRLQKLLPDPRHCIVLAVRDDQALGVIAAEHRLVLESGEFIEIMALVVAAQARKQGVGGLLLDAAEAWARSQGVAVIRVRSNVTRVESHPFYESHGYARKKSQHVYAKRLGSTGE